MNHPRVKKFKTQGTFVAHNGSLGGTVIAECIIEGNKLLDGPSYMDSLLKSIYEQVHKDFEIADCRCSIAGMYSANQFYHYTCGVKIRGVDGRSLADSIDVFVDREQIVEITEDDDEE